MFRRLPSSLPKDPIIPNDLTQLGYYVNDNDLIRMIKTPEQRYQYRINRNDRVNDVYKGAVNSCVRSIVKERLLGAGLNVLRLPLGAQEHENHVPIYVSKGIESKKRIIVIFGERNQELGIFSYRNIGDSGIKTGSAQELVDAVMNGPTTTSAEQSPGIIIANPGQLIWYRGGGRAISYHEYLNLPRQSAVHEPFRIDPVKNRAEGNSDFTSHVQYMFENVMTGMTHPEAKFDIIGLEYTGDAAIKYLATRWNAWRDRISGICLGNPQFTIEEVRALSGMEKEFADFLAKRVRAYFVADKPIETPLPGRDRHGCNCYGSGEELYEEGILIKSWRSMLDWFTMLSVLADYEEPVFTLLDETNANDGRHQETETVQAYPS